MPTTTLQPKAIAQNPTQPASTAGRSFDSPSQRRRRSIPFRMLADAFATVDEELPPEPDRADFSAW